MNTDTQSSNNLINEDKILVIDIETTGFLNNGGLIVEVGIVELDISDGTIKTLFSFTCSEEGFSPSLHKDSWIFKNSDLEPSDIEISPLFECYAEEIQEIIDKYPLGITAYNRAFDISFLKDRGIKFNKLQPCPMKVSTPVCKLPGKYGKFKWPKVQEAWDMFFPDDPYVEKHRGADDAWHEAQIIYYLIQHGHYVVEKTNLPCMEGC